MHARLAVLVNGDPERTSPIYLLHPGHQFLVGRGRHADVMIPDDVASRRHCRIHLRANGELFVTDLGSANGTELNGERVQPNEPTRLVDEDVVQIAQFAIHVSIEMLFRDEDAKPALPAEEFEVRGLIGKGGSGRVYAARQLLTGREVAVKALRPVTREDPEERDRFLSEAQLCCRVHNPHVVRVYDLRIVEDCMFLIMELVNGPSLFRRIKEGPKLQLVEILRLGEQVCAGLSAIHEQDIIHRDVKPANILITPKGDAKLTDFGIAKDVFRARSLTDSGVGLGTLPFVAPEQIVSACEADERSDVYSLGATLYCAIAGRPPFQPESARDILDMVESEPTLLTDLAPDVPPQISSVVHVLLAKDPNERPGSASAAGDLLRQVREELFPETASQELLPDTMPTPRAISVPEEYESGPGYSDLFAS